MLGQASQPSSEVEAQHHPEDEQPPNSGGEIEGAVEQVKRMGLGEFVRGQGILQKRPGGCARRSWSRRGRLRGGGGQKRRGR